MTFPGRPEAQILRQIKRPVIAVEVDDLREHAITDISEADDAQIVLQEYSSLLELDDTDQIATALLKFQKHGDLITPHMIKNLCLFLEKVINPNKFRSLAPIKRAAVDGIFQAAGEAGYLPVFDRLMQRYYYYVELIKISTTQDELLDNLINYADIPANVLFEDDSEAVVTVLFQFFPDQNEFNKRADQQRNGEKIKEFYKACKQYALNKGII